MGTPTPTNYGSYVIAQELIRELSRLRPSDAAIRSGRLGDAIGAARHFIYIETPGFCSIADTSATLPAYAVNLIAKLNAQLMKLCRDCG